MEENDHYEYRPISARSKLKCRECEKDLMVIDIKNHKNYYCPDVRCGYSVSINKNVDL